MDASNIQTLVELIILDQELIERQTPETRHLWLGAIPFCAVANGLFCRVSQWMRNWLQVLRRVVITIDMYRYSLFDHNANADDWRI